MSFAAPAYLGLLSLVGVVVLMHLLRPRRRDAVVSSLLLWTNAMRGVQAQSLGRRIADALLVVARSLAVALLVFALARPFASLGPQSGELVLILDSSASMLATDVSPSRFDRAREEAVRFLSEVEGRPAITVISAGAHPEAVVTRTRSAHGAIAAIEGMRACEAASSIDEAIDLAFSLARPGERDMVALFTDGAYGQPVALERFREAGAPSLRVFQVGAREPRNLGIVELEFRPDARREGDAEGFVSVASFSTRREDVRVEIIRDGRLIEADHVRLEPGERTGIAFGYPDFAGTTCEVRLSPGGDLRADDAARAVFPADTAVRVAVIGRECPSLLKALKAIPGVSVAFHDAEDGVADEGGTGGEADVVVCSGVPVSQTTAPGVVLLQAPVSEGPSAAGEEVLAPTILDWDRTHPVMRFVDLTGVAVEASRVIAPPEAAHVLADSTAGVLAWATDGPGQRTVAFNFDLERSDLVRRPGFPIMVKNMVGWLVPDKLDLGRVAARCGDRVALRASPGSKSVTVTDPAGMVSRIQDPPGQVVFADTLFVGVYRVRDGAREWSFAANLVSEDESNLAPRTEFPARSAAEADAGPRPHTPGRVGRRDATTAFIAAALGALALEWFLAARRRAGIRATPAAAASGPLSSRRRLLGAVRGAAALCAVLAASGVAIPVRSSVRAVMFVVDRSTSIDPAGREAQDRFVRASVAAMRESDLFGVVAFGAEPALECEAGPPRRDFAMPDGPGGVGTDIESALRVALEALPHAPSRRIVLLSDGNETQGDTLSAAAAAAASGVRVDVVPLAQSSRGEVAVASLVAPDVVSPGEPFELTMCVTSSVRTSAVIAIHRDRDLVAREDVTLSPGKNVFVLPLTLGEPGLSTFSCRVSVPAAADRLSQNNVAFTHVTAWSRPRALVVSADGSSPGYLGSVLDAAGMEVESVPPDGVPLLPELAGYDLVVLDDVAAPALSTSRMTSIRDYVTHFGGGLIVAGGRNSFGLGGYRDTPLEDALPLWSDVRERLAFPALAVVIVLDRSGSMATAQGAVSKFDLAREAAYSVVELMNDADRLGVLAFDVEWFWAVPIQATGRRAEIEDGLARLTAEGGTSLHPALVEAHSRLVETPAMVKHIIVVSDGVSASGDFEGIARKMAADGITVTTLAIGQDADIRLMKDIADWGGGRAYYTDDMYAIPRILTQEALVISRSLAVEEPFRPSLAARAPFFADVDWDRCPELGGYVVTSLKDGASAHLVSAAGDPVLASWRTGLGRSLAFTSSVGGPWGRAWSSWDGAARMWAQAARWAARAREPGGLSAKAHISDGRGRLVVDALDDAGGYVNFMDLAATILSPDGSIRPLPLSQTGPGRYEAEFEAATPGAYLAAVAPAGGRVATDTAAPQGIALAGASFSYPEEYRATGTNSGLLMAVAAATHGSVLNAAENAFAGNDRAGWAMVRPLTPLLLAALALLLAYIGIATVPRDLLAQLGRALARVPASARAWRSSGASREGEPWGERYEDLVWAAASRAKRDASEQPGPGAGRTDDRGLDYAARVYFARLRAEHVQRSGSTPPTPRSTPRNES